jgi:AraC family transcriptional regulator
MGVSSSARTLAVPRRAVGKEVAVPPFSPITLGEKIRSVQAGGFTLTETAHPPGRRLARHAHERANLAFVLGGSFSEILDRRQIECTAQDLLIKPAGEAHANRYGPEGMRCLLVEYPPEWLESLGPAAGFCGQVRHVRGGAAPVLALRLYRELGISDGAAPLAIEGLILEITADLARRTALAGEASPPRWLRQARDLLHARFSESLNFSEVAGTMGVHPVHLAREFRRHFRCTPGEYVRRLRVESAARALSHSDAPLAQIGLAAGFSHQAHFCRVFKRHTGMTPSEFRSALRSR